MMKSSRLTIVTAVFLLLCANLMQAQTQPATAPACLMNTEQFWLTSKNMEGENYLIQVSLPYDYATSGLSYPVLYFPDGDVAFGLIKGIVDMLQIGQNNRDIIVVGIGYGQGFNTWATKRTRDLSPDRDTGAFARQFKDLGWADKFIRFMKDELFPVVNKNYRTIPDSCAISGGSFSGLFNSYVLCTQPELFKGYIIFSPSLEWNNQSILKYESEYFKNHKELNCKVFIGYASRDIPASMEPIKEFIRVLQMHDYQGLELSTRVFEGETHLSVPSFALTTGLKTLFWPVDRWR
ncbi:MAG: alpha/beta hydrolase-fold protein [Bacteroidota bacterium]